MNVLSPGCFSSFAKLCGPLAFLCGFQLFRDLYPRGKITAKERQGSAKFRKGGTEFEDQNF